MPLRQLWGPASTGVVLALACAASVGRDCMQWICVLGGVFVALEAQRSGWAVASCLFFGQRRIGHAVGRLAACHRNGFGFAARGERIALSSPS